MVGGGTAGWLAACTLAARADPQAPHPLRITLVESPEVPTIGVGEGTWPTMRATLARIGIPEAEFLRCCDASFKQGTRFEGWAGGGEDHGYDHPFVPPVEGDPAVILRLWQAQGGHQPFAAAVGAQPCASALDLAPRQRAMPDYAGALNYAYHLDAVKFADLLRRHGTERLGVRLVRDHVIAVERAEDGDIAALVARAAGRIAGDLFIDCSGHRALLIGAEYGVPFLDCGDVLFNDRALAVQLPVADDSPIASRTLATAHRAGWIWDIGLPTRRGIGCVYASAHCDDGEAEAILRDHLARAAPSVDLDGLAPRRLAFRSGHRERFWERNCLAIGLSAGFLEPLEASAIVLIELSLNALLDDFPRSRDLMGLHADRFNALFRYRWDRIVEFLKLHYLLSRREEPYWRAHRDQASVPPRLAGLLRLWEHRPPSPRDFPATEEVFPAASYLYVLYGMGFPLPPAGPLLAASVKPSLLGQVEQRGRALAASLPTNRAYLAALRREAAPAPDRREVR